MPARGLFVMVGAAPRTDRLGGILMTDRRGFICTGPAVGDYAEPFESSVPGLYMPSATCAPTQSSGSLLSRGGIGGDLLDAPLSIGTYGQGGVLHDSTTSDQATFDPVPADSRDADHVSFGMVAADNGFRLAAYDVFGADGPALVSAGMHGVATRAQRLTHTEPFFVVINGDTRDEIIPMWERLAGGGTVIQNLAPSAWSSAYGMVADRYGVTWIFGAMS